jgi:hypothetical protein
VPYVSIEATRSVNLKRVFVVTREDLAAINGAIRYFLRSNANIEYELNCTDRITRKHADIKFMQEFDNYLDKAITGISIQGRSEDSKRSITFSLGEDWSNVRVYATGGEGLDHNPVHPAQAAIGVR